MVPALTAKDLEILRTVKVVTGYVSIDGGEMVERKSQHLKTFDVSHF